MPSAQVSKNERKRINAAAQHRSTCMFVAPTSPTWGLLQVHAFLYDADALLHSTAALQLEEELPAWQLEFYPPCMADSAMTLLQVCAMQVVGACRSMLSHRVVVRFTTLTLKTPALLSFPRTGFIKTDL